MTQLGDVVGVEVVDPFNPDNEPTVHPGFVVNIQQRPKGEEGPDVITAVTFDSDGNQSVRQVGEGGGLTTLTAPATPVVPTQPSDTGNAVP